ncbi:uncharacterized protein RJT20DRAFT_129286 [Scheffersomyces xylosifermentans]|uniref:uncharacterized protein n=1 Tax=Scheffersomyces xylosifermentans TaxID=1304137 RepID=UPI00315CE7DE
MMFIVRLGKNPVRAPILIQSAFRLFSTVGRETIANGNAIPTSAEIVKETVVAATENIQDDSKRLQQIEELKRKLKTLQDAQSGNRSKILDAYLCSNHFRFEEDKEKQSLTKLKQAMELIFLRDKPLVAIDVEAYERSLGKVTEIGVVVYDPEVSEGSVLPVIKPFHIIIKENLRLVNGRYVPDKKDRYMGGTSYVMPKDEAEKFVSAIISKYVNDRDGVLVGHHIEGDIKWIRSIGVEIRSDVKIVDTFRLHGISRSRGGTLRGVLREVNLPHGNLHNAANDAYFTLMAALAYCDPHHRLDKNLDMFLQVEAKSATAKKLDLFSDRATFKNNLSADDLMKVLK